MKTDLKLLHTSDWHLGRVLCDKTRHDEAEMFLEWLLATIQEEGVDVLLVAGDIFDSAAPGNRAQMLYYHFLCRAAALCRHVVVIAGNHDSPSFLDAPGTLLEVLNVHVVGCARAPEAEVLLLEGPDGAAELIVCAVPYLRDRDLRLALAGESLADKERKLRDGLRQHYASVAEKAMALARLHGHDIPVVGMGHLFVDGGSRVADDGVRELYVGSLARVDAHVFPPVFDYLALGHLHAPQQVGDRENIRYSGAPFPMGFGEAGQQKSVCLVTLTGKQARVRLVDIPEFRSLIRLRGDWETLSGQLRDLRATGKAAWLEISLEGEAPAGRISARLQEAVAGSALEILRIRTPATLGALMAEAVGETLEVLPDDEVFRRCLIRHDIAPVEWPELLRAYQEIAQTLHEGPFP